ncbi:MAG: NapC/NirT family cytochrome c [Pseudomonadota bacterium]|nr:MAG: NapC/NirT family cytochrome c [Pseudomonadota bacterium]
MFGKKLLFPQSPGRYSWLWLLLIGAVIGALVVIGSGVMVYATGTNDFCAGACHSMQFPFAEYQQSKHYMNHSGVRASCADCHIPHEYPQKLIHKAISGVRDVYAEFRGVIDTREKYEALRGEMAVRERERLRARGSAECRHCHAIDAMWLKVQNPYVARAHRLSLEHDRTCIDCHRGVAHGVQEVSDEGTQWRPVSTSQRWSDAPAKP